MNDQSGQSASHPKEERRLLTLSEASNLKMIEPSLIQRAIKTGRLPAVEEQYGKRKRYRIDTADLERWIECREKGQ